MAKVNKSNTRQIRPYLRLTIPNVPRYLAVVRAALRCLALQEGFCEETVDKLVLATDEAIANVIKHGYGGNERGSITLVVKQTGARGRSGLEIMILDRGKTVDPDEMYGRDLTDLRPGGLGVHIIRSVMDRVDYRCRAGGGMALRMTKYHEADSPDRGTNDTSDAAVGT